MLVSARNLASACTTSDLKWAEQLDAFEGGLGASTRNIHLAQTHHLHVHDLLATSTNSSMSAPDSPKLREISQNSQRLRHELKEWEKSFAAANGGRKAGRDDIKKNLEIGMRGPLL